MFLTVTFVRNLMGEDLGPLSSKELESLERQLDSSLKQIRSTRVIINFQTFVKLLDEIPPQNIAPIMICS